MDKLTSKMMRNFNRRQVYNIIYQEKRISRQRIADELNLSLPTVTQNLKSLEEAHLIERSGHFQSTGGRKSVVYSCTSNAYIAIGAHITKRSFRLVSVNIYGEILKRKYVTMDYEHSQEYYRQFGEQVNSFIKSMNVSPKRILGVGIALTALLSRDRQSVSKSILLGTAAATLADFQEWISCPCQLFHDSEAAANAELWFNPDISDALYLGINHHLNGVLIMEGKIHAGKEYSGGLVEHLTLYPGGRPCYCGKRGCLSTYCSGNLLFGEQENAGNAFFDKVRSGDREACETWHTFLSDLSIAIGSLYAVLDCDIILGGTVGTYMTEEDALAIQQLVRYNSHYAPASDFIRLGHKDVDICSCGAGIAYITEFLEAL